jgi:outer membrane lipoprotein-sorting protein
MIARKVFQAALMFAVLSCLVANAREVKNAPASKPLAPAKLSLDQVIQNSIQARGGLQALRSLQSLEMTGKMEAGSGKELPFTLRMKRPRKSRLEVEVLGKTAVQIYDGTHGWKVRPFLNRTNADPFTPQELKHASMQADVDGPLMDYASKGTKISLDGLDTVEGAEAYKLTLSLKNGDVRHLWIDAKTFNELKSEDTGWVNGKSRVIDTFYRDFKPVNGLVMPYTFETVVSGKKGSENIKVDKIIVNAKLDDSLFAAPK